MKLKDMKLSVWAHPYAVEVLVNDEHLTYINYKTGGVFKTYDQAKGFAEGLVKVFNDAQEEK